MNSFIQKEQLFLELCLLNVCSVISIITKFKTFEVRKPERLNTKKVSRLCHYSFTETGQPPSFLGSVGKRL
jgi:hypothetical protein